MEAVEEEKPSLHDVQEARARFAWPKPLESGPVVPDHCCVGPGQALLMSGGVRTIRFRRVTNHSAALCTSIVLSIAIALIN